MAPLGFLLNPTEPDSPSPPDPPPQPGPELDPQPSALKRQRSGELCSPLPFEPGLNPGFSAQCSVPEQEGIQQSSQTQHRPQDKAQDELQYTLAPPKKRTKSINWNQVHHATQAQPPSMYASGSIPAFQGTIACLEERKSISGPTSPQTPFGGDQHHGQTGTDSQPQHDPAPSESETSETLPSDSRCHAKQESEGCSHAPLKSHDSASTSQSERDVVADLPDAHDFDRAGLDGRVAQGTSLSTSASGEQDQRLDQGGIDSVIQNQTVSDHDLKDLGVSRHDSREASTKPTAGTTQSAHSSPAPQQLQSNGEVASSASIKAPPKKKGANQSKVKRETESASTSDANSTPRRGGSASATPDPSDARTTEGRSRSNEKEKERKRQRAEKRKREKELQASAALIATQPQERVPGRKDKERGKRSGDVTPILRSLEIGGGEEKDVEEAEEEEEVDGKLYCICKTFYGESKLSIPREIQGPHSSLLV
ncbi:hypothetical protein IE53DRAFT_33524 [Violaceomyces palustris]|uniref:Uncharacterized protein n=1 Tax=Violaceomyces palustris TaxID=1673888 RepID=A0ACD0P1C9_9BASI|nr:hypothetical protein IE53DRAFT_33524 [Violaceomyces palustris]